MAYKNVEQCEVKQEFNAKEDEWLKAMFITAEYDEAADTLRKTIVKIALSKDVSRTEKEAAIFHLTKSIGILTSMMANEVLDNFD